MGGEKKISAREKKIEVFSQCHYIFFSLPFIL